MGITRSACARKGEKMNSQDIIDAFFKRTADEAASEAFDFGLSEHKEGFKSGFVAFIGRPNAGKSTLLNALMGEKLAITSNTAQTTRHRFRAIYDTDDAQIIIVDTPGLHKPHDALGEELNRSALKSLEDVDLVAFLLDSSKEAGRGDQWVLDQLKTVDAPKLLVITKSDLSDAHECQLQLERVYSDDLFDDAIVLSAQTGERLAQFTELLKSYLPEGPRWFPKGTRTDQDEEVLIAEFIREKILLETSDEVPHAIGVQVEEYSYNKKKNLSSIRALIYVERESQKGIIIGKGGAKIKRLGSLARHDLERLPQTRVYLDLRVKLKKDWRKDAAQIRRFGYGEGL